MTIDELFKYARPRCNQTKDYYSGVRVRNGQWMLEPTSYLEKHAEYKYYERIDFAPDDMWTRCAVCGHISQMHSGKDRNFRCEEDGCKCTGYRTIIKDAEETKTSMKLLSDFAAHKETIIEVRILLDPVPGWGHEATDHVKMLEEYLNASISHYNPKVKLLGVAPRKEK